MPRPAIFLSRPWPREAVAKLEERYEVTIDDGGAPIGEARWIEALRRFDAVCPTVTDRLPEAVFGIADRRTRIVANFGAGFEHIDVAAAARHGVIVTNTPDVLTEATAELALLLMLMVARRAGEGERELRGLRWKGWRPTHMMGRSLAGGLLGLVGFGRIAQATARKASALGMRLAYHSRRAADVPGDLSHAAFQPDLDELLRAADCVSLHCPGGEATRHLIDGRRLALFKPGAILVNTARGSVVDETALADALRGGRLAAAGLDVYEREPAVDPALLALENVVLLPHLGSATVETRMAMGLRAAANLDAFFAGAAPRDRVA